MQCSLYVSPGRMVSVFVGSVLFSRVDALFRQMAMLFREQHRCRIVKGTGFIRWTLQHVSVEQYLEIFRFFPHKRRSSLFARGAAFAADVVDPTERPHVVRAFLDSPVCVDGDWTRDLGAGSCLACSFSFAVVEFCFVVRWCLVSPVGINMHGTASAALSVEIPLCSFYVSFGF